MLGGIKEEDSGHPKTPIINVMAKTIIQNGEIIDGTGKPGYKADIALEKDKIVTIGKVDSQTLENTIDASGLVVAPGFVDIHSHSDYYLLIDPRAESKIMQGVTTEVIGNCGYSAAPISGDLLKERQKSYQEQFGIDLNWNDLNGYYEALNIKGTAINIAPLLGHNTIRASVMGYENRQPQQDEMGKMEKIIIEGFEQGAFGMSVGLIYPPSCYAKTEELIRIFKIVKKEDGLFTCHMRSEGEKLLEAIAETIQIGREAGVRTQISHLKTAGNKNWNKINKALALVEDALDSGMDIACDRYPYTASNTGLTALLPDWVFEGGIKEQMKKFKDKKSRGLMKKEILKNHPEPEYWQTVMISQVVTDKNKDLEGKKVSEGAELRNKDIFEFIFDLLEEEQGQIEAIYFCMCEDNFRQIIKKDYVMMGSDSGARGINGPLGIGNPHPRGYGSFPRMLGKYVREENLFDLPTAVKKMTSDPCNRLKIKGRGLIKEGYYADLVLFDPKKINDTATYEKPKQLPSGIEYVFVNGEMAVKKGVPTNIYAGKGLRKL